MALAQRPDEAHERAEPKDQRTGHENDQDVRETLPLKRRIAFRTTVIELDDIAMEAASGVAKPAIATGTAMRL